MTFAEFRKGWQNVGLHLAYDPEDYRLLFDRVFDRDRGSNRVRWVDMKLALSKFKLKSPKACSPRRRSSLLAAARAYDRDRARTAVQLSVLDNGGTARDFIAAHSPSKRTATPTPPPQQRRPEPAQSPAAKPSTARQQQVWTQRVSFLMRINSMRVCTRRHTQPVCLPRD